MACQLSAHAVAALPYGTSLIGRVLHVESRLTVVASREVWCRWIKIWDARNFSCVQTFLSVSHVLDFTAFGARHALIVAAGSKMLQSFDQEGGPYSTIGENDPVLHAKYK